MLSGSAIDESINSCCVFIDAKKIQKIGNRHVAENNSINMFSNNFDNLCDE